MREPHQAIQTAVNSCFAARQMLSLESVAYCDCGVIVLKVVAIIHEVLSGYVLYVFFAVVIG